MTRAEQIIAAQNPLECEVEPAYLFERGQIRLVTQLNDVAVPLEWARGRFEHIARSKVAYGRFPRAVALLERLEDSLRIALSEADARADRSIAAVGA